MMNVFGAGDLAKANKTVMRKDEEIAKLKKIISSWSQKYKTDSEAWNAERQPFLVERMNMLEAQKTIGSPFDELGSERKAHIFYKDSLTQITEQLTDSHQASMLCEVAISLTGGDKILPSCVGGGSSSQSGWRDRDKDEDYEAFRRRAFIHASTLVKNACRTKSRSGGFRR